MYMTEQTVTEILLYRIAYRNSKADFIPSIRNPMLEIAADFGAYVSHNPWSYVVFPASCYVDKVENILFQPKKAVA